MSEINTDNTTLDLDLATLSLMHQVELEGYKGRVLALAISPDGTLVVSSSSDSIIRIWSSNTGEELKQLHRKFDCVYSIAINNDNTKIAITTDDSVVHVYDIENNSMLTRQITHMFVHCVCFSPCGNYIIVKGYDSVILIMHVRTLETFTSMNMDMLAINAIAVSPCSTKIAIATCNDDVQVWDIISKQKIIHYYEHTSYVKAIAFSLDGEYIVSGDMQNTIHVWDTTNGALCSALHGHTAGIHSIAFGFDNSTIISSSYDCTVRVWNALSGQQLKKINIDINAMRLSTISSNGTCAAIVSNDSKIKLLHINSVV